MIKRVILLSVVSVLACAPKMGAHRAPIEPPNKMVFCGNYDGFGIACFCVHPNEKEPDPAKWKVHIVQPPQELLDQIGQ